MDEVEHAIDMAILLLRTKATMQDTLRRVNAILDMLKQCNSQENVEDRFRLLSRNLRHLPEIRRIEQVCSSTACSPTACRLTASSSADDDLNGKYLVDSAENKKRISAYNMKKLRQFFVHESYNEYEFPSVQLQSQEVQSGAEGNIQDPQMCNVNASQDEQSTVEDHIQKPKKRGRRKKKSRSAVPNVDEHNGKDLKSGSEMSKQKHVRPNREEFNADNDQNKCFVFEKNIKQKRQENESQVESDADESQSEEYSPKQILDKMQQVRNNIRQNVFTTDESQTEESLSQQKSDKIKQGRNSIKQDKGIADEKFKNEKSFKQKEKESFEDEPIALEVESQVEQNEGKSNFQKTKKRKITVSENAIQGELSAVEDRIQKPKKRGRPKGKSHIVLQNVDKFNDKDLKSAFKMAKQKHGKINQEVEVLNADADQNESCVFEKNRKQESGSLVKSSANEYQFEKSAAKQKSDKRQQGRKNITQNEFIADEAKTEESPPPQKSDKIKQGKNSITQDKYIADGKFENEKSVNSLTQISH